jgi:hypothetical protein
LREEEKEFFLLSFSLLPAAVLSHSASAIVFVLTAPGLPDGGITFLFWNAFFYTKTRATTPLPALVIKRLFLELEKNPVIFFVFYWIKIVILSHCWV